jgi:hypothetical protein
MSYPTMLYATDGRTAVVDTPEAHDALPGEWFDSPAAFGLITCPSVAQQFQGRPHTSTAYAPQGVLVPVPAPLVTLETAGKPGKPGSKIDYSA